MADISSYLAAIMAAVYGEDVRGSIHDAIDIINKVGEVVLNTGTAVTGPTSSSTGFYDGSFYINTNTMELWKCIGTDAWQSQGVLKGADGADGNGIVNITKTATVGLVDTYTITYDDGGTETYQVTNGQNGSKWYKGTAISGTGTSITGFPGVINDFYLNSVDGYVYTCTKTGGAQLPDAAEWDYVMTLTGGGGASITVVDNLTSTSSTDALSANQGRVLKGYVDGKIANPAQKTDGQVLTYDGTNDVWKAMTPSSSVSDLDDLSDVTITSPANDQVLKYSNGSWVNGAAPAGGHTMSPDPTSSPAPTEADCIQAIKDAVTEGPTNDDVASEYTIGRWSNSFTKSYVIQASVSHPITTTGVGTWNTTTAQADWIEIADLIGIGSANDIDVTLSFDPTTVSVPITLGGYVIDDTAGKMCIKFGNEIASADVTTAKIYVDIIVTRTAPSIISP